MKPSTLIQILTEGGIEGPKTYVVNTILTGLRCDKCRHWERVTSNTGRCNWQDGYWLSYKFCADWEKKDA